MIRDRDQFQQDDEEFEVPPNTKISTTFFGLNVVGWLVFVPTVVIVAIAVALLLMSVENPYLQKAIVVFAGLIIGSVYFLLSIDETTGTYRGVFIYDRWRWLRSEKVVYVWRKDTEDVRSLEIELVE